MLSIRVTHRAHVCQNCMVYRQWERSGRGYGRISPACLTCVTSGWPGNWPLAPLHFNTEIFHSIPTDNPMWPQVKVSWVVRNASPAQVLCAFKTLCLCDPVGLSYVRVVKTLRICFLGEGLVPLFPSTWAYYLVPGETQGCVWIHHRLCPDPYSTC